MRRKNSCGGEMMLCGQKRHYVSSGCSGKEARALCVLAKHMTHVTHACRQAWSRHQGVVTCHHADPARGRSFWKACSSCRHNCRLFAVYKFFHSHFSLESLCAEASGTRYPLPCATSSRGICL